MTDSTKAETIMIQGQPFRVVPPADDDCVEREAWLDGDLVVEYADEDPPEDAEPITTYGIECVPNLVDADGRVVGFICPGCEHPTLLENADEYADGYRGCARSGCDAVVACRQVLPRE